MFLSRLCYAGEPIFRLLLEYANKGWRRSDCRTLKRSIFSCDRSGDGEGKQPCSVEAAVVRRPSGSLVHGRPGEEGRDFIQGRASLRV